MKQRRGPHSSDPRPHFVYQLWGAFGECLYVGYTVDLPKRLSVHARTHWFEDVREVKAKMHRGRSAALDEEGHLIATHQPRYNKQGVMREGV